MKRLVTLASCACFLLVFTRNAPTQGDLRTPNQLKQIGLAYHNYFDAKRKAPENAEDLAPYFENNERLLGELKSKRIVFFYGVGLLDMKAGTSKTILAYQKDVPARGGWVLFGDGSVKRMSAEEFKESPKAKAKVK
jgi:hypothetical protein